MDTLNFNKLCKIHPDQQILFFKINNLETSASKPFFYCQECVNNDLNFNGINYQSINEIIKSGTNKILRKWPPNNSQATIDKLIEISKQYQEKFINYVEQTISYFDDLQMQINIQIQQIKKKMIFIAEQYSSQNIYDTILTNYQKISKILELRSYFLDNNQSFQDLEAKCQQLVQQSIESKQNNTQLLSSLSSNQVVLNFDTQSADQLKQQILRSIDNINVFKKQSQRTKLNIQLLKTNFRDGENCQVLTVNNNGQPSVQITRYNGDQNTISDLILNQNKKYIIRVQIDQLKNDEHIMIGLARDSIINIQGGYNDCLSCALGKNQDIIKVISGYGISKKIKGKEFQLSKENIIELRVYQKEQILQVLDYPNYKYQMSVEDQYKSRLTDYQNLRIYLDVLYENSKVTLLDAFEVEHFD